MLPAGREQALNVGFNVTRTGMAAQTPGPAAYQPRWQAVRPSSAAAAVGRCNVAGGRHYETIRAAEAVRYCAPHSRPAC